MDPDIIKEFHASYGGGFEPLIKPLITFICIMRFPEMMIRGNEHQVKRGVFGMF